MGLSAAVITAIAAAASATTAAASVAYTIKKSKKDTKVGKHEAKKERRLAMTQEARRMEEGKKQAVLRKKEMRGGDVGTNRLLGGRPTLG